jgi:hypothetical protein
VTAVVAAARRIQLLPYGAAIGALPSLVDDARSRASIPGLSLAHQKFLKGVASAAAKIVKEVSPPVDDPGEPPNFGDRLKVLVKPPATVLRSAAQIERNAINRFGDRSTTSLAIVAKAAPAAAAQLERAVAGHFTEAPPSTQKVYALRVRAGLFGRSFPKNMQALRDPPGALAEIGEWPIIKDLGNKRWLGREQPDLITLDAVYEEIAPQTWVFVDMRGLERPEKGNDIRVGPTEELLVARAAEILPKTARADYGGSGECTAIRLAASEQWIRYAENLEPDFDQELNNREFQLVRRTTVYAAPEELALAERPLEK